jgi:hypothetical protein
MNLCECGCGREVNSYRNKPYRFINGHNNRNKSPSEETRKKLRIANKGENNPNYRVKSSHETRRKIAETMSEKYGKKVNSYQSEATYYQLRIWRKSVLERDNYTCQTCRNKYLKKNLCSHHIKPKEEFKELMYDVNNGICLCNTCHTKLHLGLITLVDYKEAA